MSEREYLSHINSIAKLNKLYDSYIGQGYYGTETPSVILRKCFRKPRMVQPHILLIKQKFLKAD